MKKMKTLALLFLAVIISSTGLVSCLDEDVSAAVESVYSAQAGYLNAQATLKNAEATFELAQAAVQTANAKYQDAQTASLNAATAGVLIENAYDTADNANKLTEAAADLATALADAQGELDEAISDNNVAMVAFADAVADAKYDLLYQIFYDYEDEVDWLDGAQNDRLTKLNEIATTQLHLDNNSSLGLAFIQAALVADLAALEAGLVSANAEIVRIEGLTASSAQQDVTDLEAEIEALDDKRDALGVELADKENDVETTELAWLSATEEYGDVLDKQAQIGELKDDLAGISKDSIAATVAIATAAANSIGGPDALAALAAVDTTSAYDAIQAQITLIGTHINPTDVAGDDDAIADPVTLNDLWYNSIITTIIAEDKFNSAYNLLDELFSTDIQGLEEDFMDADENLAGITDVTALETAWNEATAAEEAAQIAWELDPSGATYTDGDDSDVGGPSKFDNEFVGDHSDTPSTSYVQVTGWTEIAGGWYPSTYSAAASIPAIPAFEGDSEYYEFSADMPVDEETTTDPDYTFYVEVEADDNDVSNYIILENARMDAEMTEFDYNAAVADNNSLQGAYDAALVALQNAYLEVGATWSEGGFADIADFSAILAYVGVEHDMNQANLVQGAPTPLGMGHPFTAIVPSQGLYKIWMDAEDAKSDAGDDISDAEDELGFDFRDNYSGDSWSTIFDEWYDDSLGDALVTAYTPVAKYQGLEEVINADGGKARVYDAPHTGTDVTLYQALRNAYFERVWALEAIDALDVVVYDDNDYSNADAVSEATADLAEIAEEAPFLHAAMVQLEAELAALEAIAGDFDELLFDHTGGEFTWDENEDDDHGYMPLLVEYLNALVAKDIVTDAMQDCLDEEALIQNHIDHIQIFLIGDGVDAALENVEFFEVYKINAIADQNDMINGTTTTTVTASNAPLVVVDAAADGLIVDIEKATVLRDLGMIDHDDAVLLLAEKKRELAHIDEYIRLTIETIEDLVGRIELLLN